jgi:cytochrome c-type biogenesis protein CcsB
VLEPLLFKIALVAYLAATLLFLAFLLSRRRWLSQWSVGTTLAGFVAQTIALVAETVALGTLPLVNMEQSLVFTGWALVLVFLGVEFRYRLHVLGSFVLPLVCIMLLYAAVSPAGPTGGGTDVMPEFLNSAWFGIHAVFSLLGFVAFAVAFVVGVMYLIQNRMLKSKQFNALYDQLPSLDLLDAMNQGTILLGFPLLTLGMLSGAIWASQVQESFWSWTPKQALTLVTWFFYLLILHGRLNFGWRAKRAASLAIVGFAVVGVTFLYVFI